MSDQTKIATVGPADAKAASRIKIYAGLALVIPFLSFLAAFNIIPADAVEHADGILAGVVGVMGLGGFGYVANKTRNQALNGTFDEAPVSPIATAAQGLSQLQEQLTTTINVGLAGVNEVKAAADVLAAALPVGAAVLNGPLNVTASAFPDVDVLIQRVAAQARVTP